jgi:hypothetical protein
VEEELATERRLEGFDAMLEAAQGWKRAFPDERARCSAPTPTGR